MLETRSARADHQLVGRARRRRPRADPLHADMSTRRRATPDVGRRSTGGSTRWCAAGRRRSRRSWSKLVGGAARDAAGAHLCRPLSRQAIARAPRPTSGARTSCGSCELDDDTDRARPALPAATIDRRGQLRLKTYRTRRARSRCPKRCRCSRISASACSRRSPTRARRRRSAISTNSASRSPASATCEPVLARADVIERAIADVLERRGRERRVQPADRLRRARAAAASSGSAPGSAICARPALSYRPGHRGRRAAPRARRRRAALIGLFDAAHDPDAARRRDEAIDARAEQRSTQASPRSPRSTTTASCACSAASSRRSLRTNAFAPAGRGGARLQDRQRAGAGPAGAACRGARSGSISPRVEGIHLRGGPIARGGLRWSDRRDDFRTEILGLMKAQVVKNAVIVPTGAKGGFYPKQLPPPSEPRRLAGRRAPKATASSSARLLSVTDNLVNDKVVHPDERRDPRRRRSLFRRRRRQGHRDLLRHRQCDRARAQLLARRRLRQRRHPTATTTRRWASPPRAPGSRSSAISSKWASTCRASRSRVAGVGDMSGDVFGNGMLLSKAIKLVAAFDHRHIFLDPDPDPAKSWKERKRMFELPRSSWDDYDAKLISQGRRRLPAHPEVDPAQRRRSRAMLGIDAKEIEPAGLISAILKAPGRPALVRRHRHLHQGRERRAMPRSAIPPTTRIRVNGAELRAKVDRRRRQSRHHPGRPHRVRRARRPHQHRLHRQSAPASIARTMRSTSRSRSTAR